MLGGQDDVVLFQRSRLLPCFPVYLPARLSGLMVVPVHDCVVLAELVLWRELRSWVTKHRDCDVPGERVLRIGKTDAEKAQERAMSARNECCGVWKARERDVEREKATMRA